MSRRQVTRGAIDGVRGPMALLGLGTFHCGRSCSSCQVDRMHGAGGMNSAHGVHGDVLRVVCVLLSTCYSAGARLIAVWYRPARTVRWHACMMCDSCD